MQSIYYLNTLQSKVKWQNDQPNLGLHDLVLLNNKKFKRIEWKLAFIESIKTSANDIVRSCEIRHAVKDLLLLICCDRVNVPTDRLDFFYTSGPNLTMMARMHPNILYT